MLRMLPVEAHLPHFPGERSRTRFARRPPSERASPPPNAVAALRLPSDGESLSFVRPPARMLSYEMEGNRA